jgi:WD40 repeat protein
VIRKPFRLTLYILFLAALLADCTKAPEIVTMPPPTDTIVPPTITSAPLPTRTQVPPTLIELVLVRTLEPAIGITQSLQSLEVISRQNAHQITQLTSLGSMNENWGNGELAFSPIGETLVVGYEEGQVKLYNVTTQKLLMDLKTQIGFINSVAFSPDGKLIAAGGGRYNPEARGVQVWDVATQQQVLKLDDFKETVLSVRFSPDGSILATGWGNPWGFGPGSVKLWNVATGELLAEFGLPSELDPRVCWTVFEVAFNPDGTLLAAINGNGKLQLWNIANQKEEAVINVTAGYGFGVDFSPDSKLLAASASVDRHSNVIPDLRLFDVPTGELLITLEGYEFGANVTFSPNGQVLASYSWDGTVQLWDVQTGKRLVVLEIPHVAYFAFNPNGTLFATGGDIVRLWGIPEQ